MTDYRNARVCIYARVSTLKQAKNDLSIPDQVERLKNWCEQNGAAVVDTIVEPGASATDDARPQFQTMIAAASGEDRPYDVILVHSLSRLFRNAMHFMQYRAMLKRSKVRIVSITQEFGEPAPPFARVAASLGQSSTTLFSMPSSSASFCPSGSGISFRAGSTSPQRRSRQDGKSCGS